MLMLRDRVHAEKAHGLALATELVDDAELDDATQRLPRRLPDGPALAYAATGGAPHARARHEPLSGVETEELVHVLLMTSRDHAELHAALEGKRTPIDGPLRSPRDDRDAGPVSDEQVEVGRDCVEVRVVPVY
jgi:enoyl-CoA hydratase/carnithine racemase